MINRKLLKKRLQNLKMFRKYLIRQILPRKAGEKSTLVFLVTLPRSGSTALGSLFESVGPPFHYYGEIFGFNQWPKSIERITFHYPFFSSRYLKGFLRKKKEGTVPDKFETSGLKAEKVLRSVEKTAGIHVFKIMNYHFPPKRLDSLIAEFQPKVIFLRRNHLDRFISTKKAQATGKWQSYNTDADLIEVDEKSLLHSIAKNTEFYDEIRQCCLSNRIEWLDLDYSEVFAQPTLQKILDFAGAQTPRGNLLSLITTKKQDNKHLSRETFLQNLCAQGSNKTLADYDFKRQAVR